MPFNFFSIDPLMLERLDGLVPDIFGFILVLLDTNVRHLKLNEENVTKKVKG